MKQFISFIKKEFLHIFRDNRTLMMLIAMPIIQLIIFGYAITTEINNTPICVFDQSKSTESQLLIDRFSSGHYFKLYQLADNNNQIEQAFQQGGIKLALVIPHNYSADIKKGTGTDLQLLLDASDPNEASTIGGYAQQIVMQHQQSLQKNSAIPYLINTEVKMLYNPQLKSAYNFVPGIMGLVLMLICAMMTSISIVREKEQGTMEVLLVSPMKPISIVLSKAIPYLVIALFDVVCILLLSYFVLKVPIAGSLFTIMVLCMLFTLSALSLGMLISSVVNTQQAAMLISGIALMIPTMLLSGLVFPIENMPWLLQAISNIIPAKWFIIAIKDVMIKGLGFAAIYKQCIILSGMTFVLLLASVKRFKHRL